MHLWTKLKVVHCFFQHHEARKLRSLGSSLNDLKALGLKKRPRTSASRDGGIEVTGKRVVEEDTGYWLIRSEEITGERLVPIAESGLTLWKQEKLQWWHHSRGRV